MTSKFFHRIKTRALQGDALMSSILAFIGVFSKFSYILVRKDAGEYAIANMFGYRYLSQFLWAIGNEIFTFSAGVLIWMASNFISDHKMKVIFRGVSLLCISSSLYFMGWIFFAEYFEDYTEILMAILFSIVGTVLFGLFLYRLNSILNSINQLTEYFTFKIRLLTDCLILVTPDYVRNKEVYFEEVVEPTLDKLNE